jgi:hypothetical protein
MIKNARGGPELVSEPPRWFRTIGHKPADHFIQIPSAVISAIRRLTMRDRAIAVRLQHAGRLSD